MSHYCSTALSWQALHQCLWSGTLLMVPSPLVVDPSLLYPMTVTLLENTAALLAICMAPPQRHFVWTSLFLRSLPSSPGQPKQYARMTLWCCNVRLITLLTLHPVTHGDDYQRVEHHLFLSYHKDAFSLPTTNYKLVQWGRRMEVCMSASSRILSGRASRQFDCMWRLHPHPHPHQQQVCHYSLHSVNLVCWFQWPYFRKTLAVNFLFLTHSVFVYMTLIFSMTVNCVYWLLSDISNSGCKFLVHWCDLSFHFFQGTPSATGRSVEPLHLMTRQCSRQQVWKQNKTLLPVIVKPYFYKECQHCWSVLCDIPNKTGTMCSQHG